MKYIIEGEILQKLIDYLTQRPYNEVFQAVSVLMNLEKLEEKEDKK